MHNSKGSSAVVLILLLLILLAAGGGGYYFYQQKQSQGQPPTTVFEHVPVKEEAVVFVFQKIPKLYSKITQLNNELILIAAELERITTLENDYPGEKKVVQEERALWLKLQKSLAASVQASQKNIESYYVAYSVNSEKGKKLIDQSVDNLISQIDEVLTQSKTETKRLKLVKELTLMEKVKGLFQ